MNGTRFCTIWWFHFSLFIESCRAPWVVCCFWVGRVAVVVLVFSSFLFIHCCCFSLCWYFFLSRKLWLMKYNMFMCLAKFHLFSLFGITSQQFHMYMVFSYLVFFTRFIIVIFFKFDLFYFLLLDYLLWFYKPRRTQKKKTISNVISFASSWVNAQSVCRHILHTHTNTRAHRRMCRRNWCVNS